MDFRVKGIKMTVVWYGMVLFIFILVIYNKSLWAPCVDTWNPKFHYMYL